VLASGIIDPTWPAGGVTASSSASGQKTPALASDGLGGGIVAWIDDRNGTDDVYAQHVRANGTVDPAWPANGLGVFVGPGNQNQPLIVPDASGGAFVGWVSDNASGNLMATHVLATGTLDPAWPAGGLLVGSLAFNIDAASDGAGGVLFAVVTAGTPSTLVQRLLANGSVAPGWAAGGVIVNALTTGQAVVRVAPDGRGGAFAAWLDFRSGSAYDVYASHVESTGTIDAAYPANGFGLCTVPADAQSPVIMADGANGAFVSWSDFRTDPNIYVGHLPSDGTSDPLWPVNGKPVTTSDAYQTGSFIATDGDGGLEAIWTDYRSGSFGNPDIYAMRIDRFTQYGYPAPVIETALDIPADQGGKLRVHWQRSRLDVFPSLAVSLYGVWRRVDPAYAAAGMGRGGTLWSSSAPVTAKSIRPGVFRVERTNSVVSYWEGLGTVAARGDSAYTFPVSTLADSTAAGIPFEAYRVDAHGAFAPGVWTSVPLSGYSVDNLPPSPPGPFAGTYMLSGTQLTWPPNPENDIAGYRLYRGTTAGFVPNGSTFVASVVSPGYVDPVGAPYYYKLAAVDIHGNVSPFTFLLPNGTTGVEIGSPAALAFAPPSPNPARGDVELRYTLPAGATASLEVLDVSGRHVADVASRLSGAGEHTVTWRLTDDARRPVSAGVYFVVLRSGSSAFRRSLVVVR
jgi:hypothetical protein